MPDERKFPHLDKSIRFAYRVLEKQDISKDPLCRFTVNVSGGGICFRSVERLDPKTALAIELDAEEFPSPVIALASVVWCRELEVDYEVGAEFWWIGWKDSNAQQIIAKKISSTIEKRDEKKTQ